MPRFPFCLTKACPLQWVTTFYGYASTDAYRDDTITTQYADLACNLSQSSPEANTFAATCAVNSRPTLQDVLDTVRAIESRTGYGHLNPAREIAPDG